MATGKRASMREGPLADLFRKTADDEPVETALPVSPETTQAEPPRRPSLARRSGRRPSAPRRIRR